jgi:hypothetical protein
MKQDQATVYRYHGRIKMKQDQAAVYKYHGRIKMKQDQATVYRYPFFSVTVDGRNLIFGHKHHIGIPYCG